MRLLLVEDDALLGDGLKAGLTQSGYRVEWLRDGQHARQALQREHFDLVVLDLGLPKIDGLALLKEAREQGDETPILILTARDALESRIKGLDYGADDYLVKPFDLGELNARLRAIHRRRRGSASPLLHYGEITLDPASSQVAKSGEVVELTRHEFSILEILMGHLGRVVTKEHLEETIYGWEGGAESNTIEVHIHHLRKKLGKKTIQTVRGIGYQLSEVDH